MVASAAVIVLVVRTQAVLREAERDAVDAEARPDATPSARDIEIATDLVAMRDADQQIRGLFLASIPDVEPRTEERVAWLNAERDRLDRLHVERLKAIVAEVGGWPSRSRFGPLASQSACAIAVHGIQDFEFMAEAGRLMEPMARTGEADVECWAQVTDRVLVHEGRPQRWGTQLRGEELDGVFHWGVAPVEAPEGLLERRAEVGLGDYREYLDRQRRDYQIPDFVPPFPDEPVIPGLPPMTPP